MSAYVCDNEHISQIARFLVYSRVRTWVTFDQEPEALARLLFDLNERSVRGRYPDCSPEADNMPGPVPYGFEYVPSSIAVPDGQTLKSLECFLYQSCEDGHNEEPLYQQVERAAHGLRSHLLEVHCAEYRDSQWGAYKPPKDAPEVHTLTGMIDEARSARRKR